MDLSAYYEEFQQTYAIALAAVCLAVLVTGFIGIRTFRDKKEKKWSKIVSVLLLFVILASVVYRFIIGAVPMKKDVNQKSIRYYEGDFEIVEADYNGWSSDFNLSLRIDGLNATLLFVDEDERFTELNEGHYTGRLVYGQHAEQVLYLEIIPIEE